MIPRSSLITRMRDIRGLIFSLYVTLQAGICLLSIPFGSGWFIVAASVFCFSTIVSVMLAVRYGRRIESRVTCDLSRD